MVENRRKNPFIAGVLSFLFPGAGQLYNEDYMKGIILIAAMIASVVTIVYTGIALGGQVMSGGMNNGFPAMYIVRIVIAGLIYMGIWIYGIIDGITTAQRLTANAVNPAASVTAAPRTKEGTIALGVVLVLFGLICIAVQLGLKFEYLIRYGLPVALILIGGYLLAKTSGWIKGGQ
jgi:TM2 domain-containing membrane protein YozV